MYEKIKNLMIRDKKINPKLTNLFADTTPTSSRLYGKPFTTKAINQSGAIGAYGALDFNFGDDGLLDISSILSERDRKSVV